jgi:hypothetical protein
MDAKKGGATERHKLLDKGSTRIAAAVLSNANDGEEPGVHVATVRPEPAAIPGD